jgi:phosphoglycolate phosphatase
VTAERIRHVIWDWNGTLLDDVPACVEALNGVLTNRGFPAITCDQYREDFRFPVREFYRGLGMDFTPEEWDRVAREYHDNFGITSRRAPLRRDMLAILEQMRSNGISMSVLSASEISLLTSMLRERNIDRFFDRVFGLPDLYARSKLDAGRRLMAEAAFPAEATLLIGDTIHDCEVARALDCRCILLAGGHQAEHRLLGCGCPVVPEIGDPQLFVAQVLGSC